MTDQNAPSEKVENNPAHSLPSEDERDEEAEKIVEEVKDRLEGEVRFKDEAPETSGDQGEEPPCAASPDEEPVGELSKLTHMLSSFAGQRDLLSASAVGLFLLALLVALRWAQPVIVPIVLGVMISFLLAPLVSGLARIGIPRVVGSGLVVLGLLGLLGAGIFFSIDPLVEWSSKLPQTMRQVESRLRPIEESLEDVRQAGEQIDEIRQVGQGKRRPQSVKVEEPSVVDLAMTHAGTILVTAGLVAALVYFLLASADRFLEKLVKVQPRLGSAIRSVRMVRRIKQEISNYLFTISWINALLGLAVGTAMYFLDMPSPFLWGFMAALLNYIPYLGAVVGIGVVTVVAIATFDTVGQIVWVPASYFLLTTLEANIFTPLILGRRLTVSPVVIFVGLIFWTWLWGIPGALLAVPLMVVIKIICDSIEPLAVISEFLGR